MSWQSSPASSVADLERLLHQVEDRLDRLRRGAARTSSAAPRAVDRVGDSIAAALSDVAERFRDLALRAKNSAWLAMAETIAGWNGLAIRKAGSGRSPVRKRSG